MQLRGRDVLVRGGADRFDHLVQVVETDLEAFENVRPLLCALEVETGPAQDHVAAVVDEELQRLLQAQHDRTPVDDRQHDHAERGLQRRVLVQVVEHREHLRFALQLDHNPHPVAVRLVAEVGNAFELSLRDQLGDLGHEGRLVHGIGKLVDDDPLAPVGRLLQRVASAHDDAAVAGRVRGLDAGCAHDHPAGRKVRALDEAQQVLGRRLRVVDELLDRGRDLAQVVRRDVGRHADRDARRAVDEQVWDPRRQHGGLYFRVVVVRNHVNGLFLDVGHQLAGDRGELRFRVPHRRRWVPVHAAEVALAFDQRVAQREGLRHAHQCVIYRGIAVRVVQLHHISDERRRLLGSAAARRARTVHGVEDSPLHRLEPVTHVGQRPADDDGHRVLHVGGLHLLLEAATDDGA